MPKIYKYFGILFLFYSEDHQPIHIHARHGEFESKLEYTYKNGKLIGISVKKVVGKKQLPNNILKDAKKFAIAYEKGVVSKWINYYGKNIKPEFEVITKKIK